MKPKAITLLTLIAFVLVPILCLAGIIEHACDCGETAQCGHEDDCGSDPCSENAVRGVQQPSLYKSILSDACLAATDLWVADPRLLENWVVRRSPLPPDSKNLPFHPTDVPLLR